MSPLRGRRLQPRRRAGRTRSPCSRRSTLCERVAGRRLSWSIGDEPRVGDHMWWITDLERFRADYPSWDLEIDLERIAPGALRPQRRALVVRGVVKLSVVIPAHDEEGTIEPTVEQLRARLDATGKDFEIIVVDDGSTDATAGDPRPSRRATKRVRSIRSPNPAGSGSPSGPGSRPSPATPSRS